MAHEPAVGIFVFLARFRYVYTVVSAGQNLEFCPVGRTDADRLLHFLSG